MIFLRLPSSEALLLLMSLQKLAHCSKQQTVITLNFQEQK